MKAKQELLRLKTIYKTKINVELERIMKRNDIKKIQKQLGLEDYSLTMSKPQHFEELVTMSKKTYGEENLFGILLDEEEFRKVASVRLQYFCDYGRLLLFINKKTNKIDITTSTADLCDYDDASGSAMESSGQWQRLKEMFSVLYSNINTKAFPNETTANQIFRIMDDKNALNMDELNKLYGKYWAGGFMMKRKSVNPYLFAFCAVIICALMVNLGYEYSIGEATHSSIDRICRRGGSFLVSDIKDIDNFKFNDNKLMKNVLNDAFKKKQFTTKQINKFKDNMVFKLYVDVLSSNTINNSIKMIQHLKSRPSQSKL
eukprot:34690_1